MNTMRSALSIILVLFATMCLAQQQDLPLRRILPEDIEQSSIRLVRIATNSFAVRFTYTETGARKMLAFEREHRGQEIIIRVGTFEHRGTIASSVQTPGWTEEGWLKWRTDKFFGVNEDQAKQIVDGLKSR
jgi:hypothetical protein